MENLAKGIFSSFFVDHFIRWDEDIMKAFDLFNKPRFRFLKGNFLLRK